MPAFCLDHGMTLSYYYRDPTATTSSCRSTTSATGRSRARSCARPRVPRGSDRQVRRPRPGGGRRRSGRRLRGDPRPRDGRRVRPGDAARDAAGGGPAMRRRVPGDVNRRAPGCASDGGRRPAPAPPRAQRLEVLLTDAAIEPGTVGRPVQPRTACAGVAGGLARHPRLRCPARRRLRRRAHADRAGCVRGCPAQGRPPLRRPGMAAEPAAAASAAGLPVGRRGGRRRDLRRRARLADRAPGALRCRQRARRGRADELPVVEPHGPQGDRRRGGANLVRGAKRFAADFASPPRLPQNVDTSQFEVGGNLAVTPGSVVLHTDVFELIQYKPATEQVHEVPLLFIPPTINKYYILDLAPGRSVVEYLVAQGDAGLPRLLAQPRRGARPLRPRHLRERRCSRRATPSPPSRRRRR